jgi:hypothetical protein
MIPNIFLAIVGGALVLFALFYLLEQRKLWKNEILEGVTGVKDWRKRLNGNTDRFVALGREPLLAQAASKTADPVAAKLSGKTLAHYQRLKDMYVALSYAYNCGARAVQQAEGRFKINGPLKLVTIRDAGKLAEQGLEIKEIHPHHYLNLVAPDRYAPKPPVYHLDYIFSVCDKLTDEIARGLTTLASYPAQVTARLATADKNRAAATAQYNALRSADVTYLPYEQRLTAIAVIEARVSANIGNDAIGALALCTDLDKGIQALAQELDQAKTQLTAVSGGEKQLAASLAYVVKVRATPVTCPWSDNCGEPTYWTLSTPDSDPDSQLAQSATLFTQARQSLVTGQLQTVSAECAQALAARNQAEKMVKALFEAKTAIDEQVPRVRAELAAIRAEQIGITGGASTHEMAQLVERTCTAVEGRIKEVHALYLKQQFPQALNLLTGTAGNEYGLPVAKLLAQAKELLSLLKKAAAVASTLTPQAATQPA